MAGSDHAIIDTILLWYFIENDEKRAAVLFQYFILRVLRRRLFGDLDTRSL